VAASEYLHVIHGQVMGKPVIDLGLESRVQELCRDSISRSIISSAHDCSEGGLAVALAESCIPNRVGFRSQAQLPNRWDAALFGERQSRIVVSLEREKWDELASLAAETNVPLFRLGDTGGSRFRLGTQLDASIDDLEAAWRGGLEAALDGVASV
jgi:phosphoribosylformylglycinamidine synthase